MTAGGLRIKKHEWANLKDFLADGNHLKHFPAPFDIKKFKLDFMRG